ncbi:MAG: hypothetical protein CMJ42_16240 [Phyllobacteriaceae bacterium]|nr:hypothetical protein [Phyllobacteriaceae bacterium]MBA89265.1 hypothetical protein [Phyllobacteriaceae bacterium]
MFHTLNPNLILGYHGCDASVGEGLLNGAQFTPSENDYDWLGPGIYFWESNPQRALSFATEQMDRGRINKPFVVGAVLSLGKCIDTMSEDSILAIEQAHKILLETLERSGEVPPRNGGGSDLLLRRLDCAVMRTLHGIAVEARTPIDSVRGLYHEGDRLYDNSGFYRKSHVQIAICNPECIKGIFRVSNV